MHIERQYDEICNSIRNGQRKQAYAQMLEISAYDRANMLDYFANDLADKGLAIDAAKTFFRRSAG